MGEWSHFAEMRRYTMNYRAILLATFALTVVFDLTVAVEVGMVMAALFFITRVSSLTDIVDEVEAQLNSTRSQASKAAKYREISAELKTLWTGMAADDARLWSGQLVVLRQAEEVARAEAEGLASNVQVLEELSQQADSVVQEIESRVRDLERRSSSNRESIASQEATIRHQTIRLRELNADLERVRKQRLELIARAGAAVRELDETAVRLREFEEGVIKQEQAIQGRDRELTTLRSQLDEARTRVKGRRKERDQLTLRSQSALTRIATLELQQQTAIEALEKTRGRIDQMLAELASAQVELEQRRQSHALADNTSQQARAPVDAPNMSILDRPDNDTTQSRHSGCAKAGFTNQPT